MTYHGPCITCDVGVFCHTSPLVRLNFALGGYTSICIYCSNRTAYPIKCRSCYGAGPMVVGATYLGYTSERRAATLRVFVYQGVGNPDVPEVRELQVPNLTNPYGWREQGMRAPFGPAANGGAPWHELVVVFENEWPVTFKNPLLLTQSVSLTNWPPPVRGAEVVEPAPVNRLYREMRYELDAPVGEAPDDAQIFQRRADGTIPCRCNRCR